ncbi:hypothetical protein SAMN04488522_104138 [Pedobacter caeni]|uniref:Uncharacterized protein n=1 Tax=Pedobacter caeni TaxID=288992 RepID=A0A1M5GAQ3_9SPHI|nr:hypothetical protein SAMN04488522_104138 [Pedobacter caeni]
MCLTIERSADTFDKKEQMGNIDETMLIGSLLKKTMYTENKE